MAGSSGTDLIISKIAPGSSYGEGYLVEIFDQGNKSDEQVLPTKKRVLEFIKEQKARYNTNRAFENAIQLHIEYKTEKPEVTKTPQYKGFPGGKSSMVKGENKMGIDSRLWKQAAEIQYLLNKLEDPSIPFKKYSDVATQTEKFPPEDELVQMMKDEIIRYFGSGMTAVETPAQPEVSAAPNTEVPAGLEGRAASIKFAGVPYNDIKEWLRKTRDYIKQLNTQGASYNLKSISDKLKDIFKGSGLPGEEILFKAADHREDMIKTLEGDVNRDKDIYLTNVELLDKEDLSDDQFEAILSTLAGKENKTENDYLLFQGVMKQCEPCAEAYSSMSDSLWKYIKGFVGVDTFDNIFTRWVTANNICEEDAQLLKSIEAYKINRSSKFASSINDVMSNYYLPYLFEHKLSLNEEQKEFISNSNPFKYAEGKIDNLDRFLYIVAKQNSKTPVTKDDLLYAFGNVLNIKYNINLDNLEWYSSALEKFSNFIDTKIKQGTTIIINETGNGEGVEVQKEDTSKPQMPKLESSNVNSGTQEPTTSTGGNILLDVLAQ